MLACNDTDENINQMINSKQLKSKQAQGTPVARVIDLTVRVQV